MPTLLELKEPIRVAMDDLRDINREVLAERRKNATGELGSTMRISATNTEGTLSALDYWKYSGNGRGPGGMPPIGKMQAWIDAKGLDLNAWAVAKKMAKEGSKDHREGNENTFETAHGRWEQSESMTRLQFMAAKAMSDGVVRSFVNLKRA